jgi:hypothetical protein
MISYKAKRWIVKHVTHRDLKDSHQNVAKFINEKEIKTTLDVAPSHYKDLSKHYNTKYTSIGLFGHNEPDIKHDLEKCPWPVKDNSHELVVLSAILEHLENPIKALNEAFRIATRYVIIIQHLNAKANNIPYDHKWTYDTKFIIGRSCGKFMPKFIRRLVTYVFARSIIFIIRVNK